MEAKPLREHRHAKLRTLKGLAAEAGVSYATLVECELGRRVPTIRTIEKVCGALGVVPEEVVEFARALEHRGRTYRELVRAAA